MREVRGYNGSVTSRKFAESPEEASESIRDGGLAGLFCLLEDT